MNRKQRRAQKRSSAGATERAAPLDSAFLQAAQHHRADRLPEALDAYSKVRRDSPAFPDAMRLGGQVALQLGEAARACDLLTRAVEARPDDARSHYNLGYALKQCGRDGDALEPFRRAAALDPADPEAPANLGAVLASMERHAEALPAFEQALKRRADHPGVLANMGLSLLALNRAEEALTILDKARAADPGHQDAAITRGAALRRLGRLDDAIAAFESALSDGSENPLALSNLGATLLVADRVDEAVTIFHRLVAATPGDAAAHYALGNALYDQGTIDEAETAFRQAIYLRPDFGEAWDNLGIALQALGDTDGAADAHRKATDLMPEDPDCRYNLATVLHAEGRGEDARLSYERCLRLDPDHAGARYMLASLTGGTAETAPPGYVENLFDAYARWFDHHLVDTLGYRTPELMRDLFNRVCAGSGRRDRGLDLGCGTGLGGAAFRDTVSYLAGVDISRRMIAEARAKAVYDDLHAEEMLAYLARTADQPGFDLVIATDAIVYMGDLSSLFAGLKGRLAPGGRWLLSVEEGAGDAYRLGPAGRFSHGREYIERLAGETGFTVLAAEATTLRRDQHEPVGGLLFALRQGGD